MCRGIKTASLNNVPIGEGRGAAVVACVEGTSGQIRCQSGVDKNRLDSETIRFRAIVRAVVSALSVVGAVGFATSGPNVGADIETRSVIATTVYGVVVETLTNGVASVNIVERCTERGALVGEIGKKEECS